MTFRKKIGAWIVDYGHMVRGTLATVVYRKPPSHYLGHVVSGKVPVILIPGILEKWSFMKKLGDAISLSGHPVYIVPDLSYNLHSIPLSAGILHSLILDVIKSGESAEKGQYPSVALVAHSKGGLIGKYLLSHFNADHHVAGMIAIATPFSGSAMAKLVPHNSFKELQADSNIIQDLQKHTHVNKDIVSIIPKFDNHVWSEKGSYLEGAENLEVPVYGHHAVLFSDLVIESVLNSLKKIETA